MTVKAIIILLLCNMHVQLLIILEFSVGFDFYNKHCVCFILSISVSCYSSNNNSSVVNLSQVIT